MFGFCSTQLTNVEQEQNGLYTYDRVAKFDPKVIHKIFARKAAIDAVRNLAIDVGIPQKLTEIGAKKEFLQIPSRITRRIIAATRTIIDIAPAEPEICLIFSTLPSAAA